MGLHGAASRTRGGRHGGPSRAGPCALRRRATRAESWTKERGSPDGHRRAPTGRRRDRRRGRARRSRPVRRSGGGPGGPPVAGGARRPRPDPRTRTRADPAQLRERGHGGGCVARRRSSAPRMSSPVGSRSRRSSWHGPVVPVLVETSEQAHCVVLQHRHLSGLRRVFTGSVLRGRRHTPRSPWSRCRSCGRSGTL